MVNGEDVFMCISASYDGTSASYDNQRIDEKPFLA